MTLPTADDTSASGHKHPRKKIYKRDPANPDQAPRKPPELAKGKSLSIRFTQSEWDSLLAKAALAGTTVTDVIRAGALGLAVQAVVSREWTAEERVDYRALVGGMNNLNQLTKAVNLNAHEREQVTELYTWMRPLLAALVPARTGQKEGEK